MKERLEQIKRASDASEDEECEEVLNNTLYINNFSAPALFHKSFAIVGNLY